MPAPMTWWRSFRRWRERRAAKERARKEQWAVIEEMCRKAKEYKAELRRKKIIRFPVCRRIKSEDGSEIIITRYHTIEDPEGKGLFGMGK